MGFGVKVSPDCFGNERNERCRDSEMSILCIAWGLKGVFCGYFEGISRRFSGFGGDF
jgi:hypothetical protein